MFKKRKKNKKGIEMIEVVISVAILGVLAITVFGNVGRSTKATTSGVLTDNNSRIQTLQSEMSTDIIQKH